MAAAELVTTESEIGAPLGVKGGSSSRTSGDDEPHAQMEASALDVAEIMWFYFDKWHSALMPAWKMVRRGIDGLSLSGSTPQTANEGKGKNFGSGMPLLEKVADRV